MTAQIPGGKPRVCMWSYHWPPDYSGAGLQARRLSRELARRGWPVWALASSATHRRVTEADDDGMRVVWVPRSRGRRFFYLAAQTIWRYRGALRRRRREFDILHVHSAFLDAALGATMAHRWGKGCLVKNTLTSVDLVHCGHGLWGKWQRWAFQHVGAFVGPSEAAADEFLRVGLPPEKIHRIPNGVNTQVFHPPQGGERAALRAKLGLPPEAEIAINHSALAVRKGTDTLVEAMGLLANHRPALHLALVGPWERDGQPMEGDSPEWFPRLKRRIAELGLERRVHIPGAQSNVEEWLRAADVFTFPTVNEGLPNSMLEAMATGMPVVAFDIADFQGVLSDGESGLLAPPGDTRAFADRIEAVLDSPALANRLGAAARAHVQEVYSLDQVVSAYERLYMGLVASQSRGAGGRE
jgi:glycosyltransferase involved in cell wall biosynthesis